MSFLDELKGSSELPTIPGIEWNQPVIPKKDLVGDVGLELELEGRLYQGRDLNAVTAPSGASWTVHNDGSLRNGGLEYVLSTPCKIDEVPGLVEGLFATLKANNARIQNSNRTSTHVHVNTSGMKVSELTSMVCLWGIVEPLVIEWCGPLRRSNQFCLSAEDTGGWVPAEWAKALKSGRFNWDNTWKYSALNLGSFRNLGSFEFRCMAGADGPEGVNSFARLVWALREEAKQVLPDQLGWAVSEMSPEGILRGLRDKYNLAMVDDLLKQTDVNHRSIKNFREYQTLSFMYPWVELKGEIDKKYIQNPFTKKAVKPTERNIRIEDINWTAPPLNPRARGINIPAPEPRVIPRARFEEDDRLFRQLVRTDISTADDVARIFGYRVEDIVIRDGFYYGVSDV